MWETLKRLIFGPEPWPDDPECAVCHHGRHDHQDESPDGACAHFPCTCLGYRP